MNPMSEAANASDGMHAAMGANAVASEHAEIHGRFHFELFEFEGGPLIREWWEDNVVCTAGKNVALDAFLAGSAYTVVGPYLGLISSTSFSAVAAADTMASHAGWLESGSANAPTMSSTRATVTFSAAASGSKVSSSSNSFTFTGAGTVQGAFLCYGTAAVSTVDSTAGTLYSASAFASAQPVISGNVLSVTYTASL